MKKSYVWRRIAIMAALAAANVAVGTVLARRASAADRFACVSGTTECYCIVDLEICSRIPPFSAYPCQLQADCAGISS